MAQPRTVSLVTQLETSVHTLMTTPDELNAHKGISSMKQENVSGVVPPDNAPIHLAKVDLSETMTRGLSIVVKNPSENV